MFSECECVLFSILFIEVKSNSSAPASVTVSSATGNGRHTVEYVFVTSRKYFAVLKVGKYVDLLFAMKGFSLSHSSR